MDVKRYRKKPVVIEALLWTGSNLKEIINFTGLNESARKWTWEEYEQVVASEGLKIFTLEGPLMASIGDFIIKGVKDEFYPCKPDIFEATYDDIKHLLTRPDPMSKEEAEILIKDLVDKAMEYRQTSTLINQDALTDAADKMVAILTIPRPDPAEVERLIDRLIGLIREEEYADSQGFFAKVKRLEEQIVKARAELLKLIGL